MRIYAILLALTLAALPQNTQAQISISPDDLRLPLNLNWESEVLTVIGSLAEAGVNVGASGADQTFDLTGAIPNSTPIRVRSSIIPLDQAPNAADFPAADYAVFNTTTAPDATGSTSSTESYAYFQRSPSGDIVVGADGPGVQIPFPAVDVSVPWPLEFGKSWSVEDLAIDLTLAPGFETSSVYDYQYAVDSWGTITVPAGTFDCLRVHQVGTGTLRFVNNEQLEALGEAAVEINAYVWYIRGIGAAAMAIETRQAFASGDIPPSTTTQIIRLTELSSPASAVVAESWGALKLRFSAK